MPARILAPPGGVKYPRTRGGSAAVAVGRPGVVYSM
jgi:hypothetical protein